MALAWLAVSLLLVIVGWDRLGSWRFPDPDDSLRLVQVRDLLAGQPWFDLHQYRINPGSSAVMHWSRIVDVPLVAVIATLAPMLGQPLAEDVAALMVPLLTLGAIMAVVGLLAFRLFGKEIAGFACLACGLSPILLAQVQPLRIDHHGWQVFMVIAAVAALLNSRPLVGSAIAGLAMAAGLLISIETLPLAAAFAAVMLLRWLRAPEQQWRLPAYLLGLAGGLVAFFALTRGFADPSQYCDAIAPAHLLFFVLVALASSGLAALRNLPRVALVGLLGLSGAAALAAFLYAAPACLNGPFGSLDPLVREYWYLNVFEGRPAWIQPYDRSVPVVLQALVALTATIVIWRQSTGSAREWWLDYVLLFTAALIGGLLVWRSMAFVGVLSALPNGWIIHRVLLRYRSGATILARLGTIVAAICVLVPMSPVQAFKMALPSERSNVTSTIGLSSCDLDPSVMQLDGLAPATVFAPIDIGPSILEHTRHSVVATGHHRAQSAMRDVIDAFMKPDTAAHAIISGHGAQYVVICTDLAEPRIYSNDAPDGLMAHLLNEEVPDWLEEVTLDTPPTFKVWRITR